MLALGVMATVGLAAWAGMDVVPAQLGWLTTAVTSGSFLLGAGVLLTATVGLVAVVRMLYLAGRPYRLARRAGAADDGGAVIIEFALALPIALMLVLLMVQSSLLMAGNLCVHYAAYCAARTAAVQIPADWSARSAEQPNDLFTAAADGKMDAVRRAAVWAVLPVSSSREKLDEDDRGRLLAEGLEDFFDRYDRTPPGWVSREQLARKYDYAARHTEVALEHTALDVRGDPPDGSVESPVVCVAVKHTFYLSIPFAGRLLYFLAGEDGEELDGLGAGEYGLAIRAATSLTCEGPQEFIEVEYFN